MAVPHKPTPPEILHVCDHCGKKWHTCYCRAWFTAFFVCAFLVLVAVVLIANFFETRG